MDIINLWLSWPERTYFCIENSCMGSEVVKVKELEKITRAECSLRFISHSAIRICGCTSHREDESRRHWITWAWQRKWKHVREVKDNRAVPSQCSFQIAFCNPELAPVTKDTHTRPAQRRQWRNVKPAIVLSAGRLFSPILPCDCVQKSRGADYQGQVYKFRRRV